MPGDPLYHRLVFPDGDAAMLWLHRLVGALDWAPATDADDRAGAAAWLADSGGVTRQERSIVYASARALKVAESARLNAVSEGTVAFTSLPRGLSMIVGDPETWAAYERRGRMATDGREIPRAPLGTRATRPLRG